MDKCCWCVLLIAATTACGGGPDTGDGQVAQPSAMDASTEAARPMESGLPEAPDEVAEPRPDDLEENENDPGPREEASYCHPFSNSPPIVGTFTKLAAGLTHVCGLTSEGAVRCWRNDEDPNADPGSPPTGRFTDLAVGDEHACALTQAGSPLCWAFDTLREGWEVLVQAPAGPFVSLDGGAQVTCGLTSDGLAQCWGRGWNGVTMPDVPLSRVEGGLRDVCGITLEGALLCWGPDDVSSPFEPIPSGEFIDVALAWFSGCAVDSSGQMHCFRQDDFARADCSVALPGSFERVETTNVLTDCVTCGITTEGTVTCSDGLQLSDGPYTQIVGDEGAADAAQGGRSFLCALTERGQVECHGARVCYGCSYPSTPPCEWEDASRLNPESDAGI